VNGIHSARRSRFTLESPSQEELQEADAFVERVPGEAYLDQYIETVISKLTNLFAKEIHAVTPRGFELNIIIFLLASSSSACRSNLG
jgi:hypothetical protein